MSIMGFYQDRVVPCLIHLAMRNRDLVPYRKRVVSSARGRVLEVGIGSGMNIPFYPPALREVIGLEPSARLVAMTRRAVQRSELSVELIEGSAEAIPLDQHSIDSVVTTWTLCSIPRVAVALSEMRRVLKPQGQLLFVEHGRAPEERVRRWQDRLTPAWKRLGGGCHLNRPIRELIEASGFSIARINTGYMKGPKALTFMYEGCALPY
jgi:ubiquinone/menaquinone biosynthesis C-methylase UbiE